MKVDPFETLPDPILIQILNRISDAKTLTVLKAVSSRFAHLVPLADSLLLRVDRVITDADPDSSFLLSLLAALLRLFSPSRSHPNTGQNPNQILSGFRFLKHLQVELPSGDLKLEKCTCIKWRAEFGRSLKFCVILAFRNGVEGGGGGSAESFSGSGLKMRVVWTISALIAASARHYMILDVINEQRGVESLVIRDREMEGVVVMDKSGLDECRASGVDEMENNRTTVPAVRMRMRHEARMVLSSGVVMEGATLVIVRPIGDGRGKGEGNDIEEQNDDVELAMKVFGGEGGMYTEAVHRLLHCKSYILEMNSF